MTLEPDRSGPAIEDRGLGYRKTVIKVYLGLRGIFVITGLGGLLFLHLGLFHLPGAPPTVIDSLWGAFLLFFSWSLILLVISLYALPRGALNLVDRLIFTSLIPDGLAIYLASTPTGGPTSPLYHSVYFLIAIHSYHLAVPDIKKSSQLRWSLGKRYFFLSALPSVCTAFTIYLAIGGTGGSWTNLRSWIELGFHLVMATSFAWLGLQDSERSRDLAKQRIEISEATEGLKRSKRYQERLLKALGRVTNIAETEDPESLNNGLNDLAREIGNTFEVDYCAVGLAKDSMVEDVGLWTSFERSSEAQELLEKFKVNPIEGSLIGSVLLGDGRPLIWDYTEHGDILDPTNPELSERGLGVNTEAAASYREILPGGEVRQMLLLPFYDPNDDRRPVGYLHLINRRPAEAEGQKASFTKAHEDSLQAIAGQLAIAIENFRLRRSELEEQQDEKFISKIESSDKAEDPFPRILELLNKKMNSRVASIWVPIEDGFGNSGDARKLVLRSVYVSGGESSQNKALARKLQSRGLQKHENSYIGRFLDSGAPGEIHYQPDLSQHDHCWDDLLDEIGTSQLLLLPVQDPLAVPREGATPATKHLAVLSLRPMSSDFQLTPDTSTRLQRFARLIENLILEKRLRRRFQQIRQLKEGIERIQLENSRKFYPLLVQIVQEIMSAEACTLFLRGRSRSELLLKASTAERAFTRASTDTPVNLSGIVNQPVLTSNDGSIISEVFNLQQSVLVHDGFSSPFNPSFVEITNTRKSRALVLAPIVGHDGEAIGVLQCVNQQKRHRPFPYFLTSDLEFFTLLSGVVARFIESTESGEARRKFLRELTHELATPLLQAQLYATFIERTLEGRRSTKDPIESVRNLKKTLQHLQKQTEDIQFQLMHPESKKKILYNINGPVDVHDIVEQIRKPMLEISRESRAIEIYGHTSKMPKLYVDRARMEQVLYNLVQNAVKYSRFGGDHIWIKYDLHEEEIPDKTSKRWHRIRIENHGIGVPLDEEESIFEEFTRGSNTQFVETGQSGTGQGLSMARRIVEHHGGILRLERRDNPTIFAVLLPGELKNRKPSQ